MYGAFASAARILDGEAPRSLPAMWLTRKYISERLAWIGGLLESLYRVKDRKSVV